MKKQWVVEALRYLFGLVYVAGLVAMVWGVATFVPENKIFSNEEPALPRQMLEEILPPFDNGPERESFWIEQKRIYPAYRVMQETDPTGQVLERYSLSGYAFLMKGDGYAGEIVLAVGIDPHGKISGVRLVRHTEPRAFAEPFRRRPALLKGLQGLGPESFRADADREYYKVSRATVTSRAILQTVRRAVEFYDQHRALFLKRLSPHVQEGLGGIE